ARLARVQAETGDRAASARSVAEFLRVMDTSVENADDLKLALMDLVGHEILPAAFALGDWVAAERVLRYDTSRLEDLCAAMASTDRSADAALARARREESPSTRVAALIGVARGVVRRGATGQPPKYDGAFAVAVPEAPAAAPR